MKKAWPKAQKELRKRLGPTNYNIWISPISEAGIGEDWIRLQTPDQHFSDHVREHFFEDISHALKLSFGEQIQIEFQSEPEVERSTPIFEKKAAKRPTGIPKQKNFNCL